MAIAGINFDKILVEKLKPIEAPLKINSNLSLTDITKEKDTEKAAHCCALILCLIWIIRLSRLLSR